MKLLVVDAFTDRPFAGNPAAVCLLDKERDDEWMQTVAAEMNLSGTAFIGFLDDGFRLRFFTPAIEVDLSGHTTLASAHALWTESLVKGEQPIRFHTKSGLLTCTKEDDFIELDFPATPAQEVEPPAGLLDALGVEASFVGKTVFDLVVVADSEQVVRSLIPDLTRLRQIPVRGVIVTSRSENPQFDFVSRFFAPTTGINEDPVTGSAHCCLGPLWSERLGKAEMTAFQASARGGTVRVKVAGDRVRLGGQAVTVWNGELAQPSSHTSLHQKHEGPTPALTLRSATGDDVPLLAMMNKQLIDDERSRNPMSVSELGERMTGWIMGDWKAVLIQQNGDLVGYILYELRSDEYVSSQNTLYVRQFFIGRDHRRRGIGRQAFQLFARTHCADASSVVLEVLENNSQARRFWEALGFRPYCTTMILKR